jgi:hypothetical protein
MKASIIMKKIIVPADTIKNAANTCGLCNINRSCYYRLLSALVTGYNRLPCQAAADNAELLRCFPEIIDKKTGKTS